MPKDVRNKTTLAAKAALQAASDELEQSLSDHVAASDPHTGYVKESDSNYVDLTDAGNTTLHTHDIYALDTDLSTHAGAADPHTVYLKESAVVTILSGTFAIDSTGVKTVTTAHGLSVTPDKQDVQLTVVEDTDVDDWVYGFVKIESVDGTNVVAKVNVTTQSATGGATAKLSILVIVGV